MKVTEREEIRFEIELSHTDVDVVWYKNGAKITRGKNIDILSKDAKHSMIIHHASMEDYGVEVVAQAEEESSRTTMFVDG